MPGDSVYLAHSLAEAQPGESLEVVDILFEESRRHCAEAGVRVGTRARCRERTDDGIRLDLSDGRRAEIESSLASFIWVHVLEPGAPAELPSVQTPLSGRISTS